jgi:hypothetical protein
MLEEGVANRSIDNIQGIEPIVRMVSFMDEVGVMTVST